MKIPINFPNDADVIAKEAARSRALSPIEHIRELEELQWLYHFQLHASGKAAELTKEFEANEERGRAVIKEFVKRHG